MRSINSVAAKMRASLMVEAELLVEAQVVLDRDGCDVYLALARQLADTCSGGGSRGPSRCRKGSSPCSVGQEARRDWLIGSGGSPLSRMSRSFLFAWA